MKQLMSITNDRTVGWNYHAWMDKVNDVLKEHNGRVVSVTCPGDDFNDATARTGQKLRDKAKLVQMKFVADNIDEILEANPTNAYFGRESIGYYFTKNICLEYAKAFHFPDDIKKDWAEALYTFLQHWLYALNCEYGPPREKDDLLLWWPEDVREARQAILDTRVRLHPLVHNGRTYEQDAISTADLIRRILPLKEEQ